MSFSYVPISHFNLRSKYGPKTLALIHRFMAAHKIRHLHGLTGKMVIDGCELSLEPCQAHFGIGEASYQKLGPSLTKWLRLYVKTNPPPSGESGGTT